MNVEFQFSDLSSFLWMDGHGPYVWACYIVTWLGLTFLVTQPIWQRKQFVKQQRALARRSAQHSVSHEQES